MNFEKRNISDLKKNSIFMRVLYPALCLVLAMALCSCGKHNDGMNKTINTVLQSNPQNLDPQISTDSASMSVIRNIFEGLVTTDENGAVICAAAESYDVSADGLNYTFRLREGISWKSSNGFTATLTADDYVYAFRRIFDPRTMSPYTELFSCLKNSAEVYEGVVSPADLGVTAKGERTIVFTLDHPVNDFLNRLASTAAMPCCEDFFLASDGRYGLRDEFTAGNGRFFLADWNYDPYWTENFLLLERNGANSTSGSPTCPLYVNYKVCNSDEEYAAASADADCFVCTAADKPSMRGRKAVWFSVSSVGMVFNPENRFLADSDFRRALAIAADSSVYEGRTSEGTVPAYGIFPERVMLGARSLRSLIPENTEGYFGSQSAAESLQRGLDAVRGDPGMLYIIIPDTAAAAQDIYLTSDIWKDRFGLECSISVLPEAEYEARIRAGDYDIAVKVISPGSGTPSGYLREFEPYIFDRETGNEFSGLISDGERALADADAAGYFGSAEELIISKAYYIPLFYQSSRLICSEKTEGLYCDPFSGGIYFRDAKKYD